MNPSTNQRVYEDLAKSVVAIEPPFTSALAAGLVRMHGAEVRILDANAEGLSAKETAERINNYDPNLVVIIVHGHQPSASSQLMGAVGELCTATKALSDAPIVLSGIHPSSLPERTLREEACDYVIRGEPYASLLQLTKNSKREEIGGLCWLDESGNFRMNKAAPLMYNLDEELPTVAWDLLPPLSVYRAHNWHALDDINNRQPYGSIYTSLGCPFTCSFCCINAEIKASLADNEQQKIVTSQMSERARLSVLDEVKPRIRYWSPDKVMENLEYFVEKQGVRHVKFIDEMFVFDKKHVGGICDKILERKYDLNIWAYARVDTVNSKELLDKMKSAGINWLVLGIESSSKHVRAGANKRYGNEAIIEAVNRVKEAGINIVGNYIFGLPDDTLESLRETLQLAKELRTEWYNGYAAMAYPGAPLYNIAKDNNIALPGDEGVPGGWTAYSHHSYYSLPMPTETLSAAEVLKFRDEAFTEYVTDPGYLQFVENKFGVDAATHLKDVAEIPLKRRIIEEQK